MWFGKNQLHYVYNGVPWYPATERALTKCYLSIINKILFFQIRISIRRMKKVLFASQRFGLGKHAKLSFSHQLEAIHKFTVQRTLEWLHCWHCLPGTMPPITLPWGTFWGLAPSPVKTAEVERNWKPSGERIYVDLECCNLHYHESGMTA